MGMFDTLFNSKAASPETALSQEAVESQVQDFTEENPTNSRSPQIDQKDAETKSYWINYGTGFPIDVIYGYINRDFEQKGFDDAMVNMDPSYKESGKKLIVNKLKVLFQQVSLRYQGDLQELAVTIETMQSQGLPLQMKRLETRQKQLENHVKRIEEMKMSLERGDEEMMRMVMSYERGFKKGMIAKSNSMLNNNGD